MDDKTKTPWYDDPEQMAARLLSDRLDGLHAIQRERHDAYYVGGTHLNEWIVLGRWLMDTCGNTMIFTEGAAPGGAKLVETKREFADRTGGVSWSATFLRTPRTDSQCFVCRERWTLANCHDAIDTGNSEQPEFAHVSCYKSRTASSVFLEFAATIAAAGFQVQPRCLPNRYCPCDHCPPWFQFDYGAAQITLGWRKRVVHIEWHGVDIDGEVIFKDEAVTKDRFYVHAWGMKDVEKYLVRLRDNLRKPRPGERPAPPLYESVVIGAHMSLVGGRS